MLRALLHVDERMQESLAVVAEQHRPIVDAIEAGDVEAAIAHAEAHCDQAGELIAGSNANTLITNNHCISTQTETSYNEMFNRSAPVRASEGVTYHRLRSGLVLPVRRPGEGACEEIVLISVEL
jgi:hypothetical protein